MLMKGKNKHDNLQIGEENTEEVEKVCYLDGRINATDVDRRIGLTQSHLKCLTKCSCPWNKQKNNDYEILQKKQN